MMTKNGIEDAQNLNCKYKIYRVYDLNIKTRSCRIKIYERPISNENFRIITHTGKGVTKIDVFIEVNMF